ncbi:RNA polymerase sigma factor [Parapedobacter sp. DT-150]|uniref:RNA polymerase sigma factor n=1 Tax=Parapedobacter sp. DT-150 TaxID=3396162 RepID=UPI003F1D7B0C
MTRFEFNTLVVQHTESLRGYALHFTRDDEDANDLVQDTMLKAVTYHGRFKEGTNLKGWLYTIMKNTFINNYRRFVKTSMLVSQTDEISSAHLLHSAATNGGERTFVMDDIKHAMAGLTDEYYVPFSMYFEGYKYHEISAHLRIPIGTVKTRIHVARRTMKKALTVYQYERS